MGVWGIVCCVAAVVTDNVCSSFGVMSGLHVYVRDVMDVVFLFVLSRVEL